MPKTSEDADVQSFPGRDLLLAAGLTGGPKELNRHLAQCFEEYYKDKSAGWPALFAFALIANEAWTRVIDPAETPDDPFDRIDPLATVDVPWWAVQAIAIAWCRHETEQISLDRAFGTARRGNGLPSAREKSVLETEQRGYAREVAWRLPSANNKVYLAISEVAAQWGVSERTIRKAWSKHGKEAKREADAVRASSGASK
jgi:hypothetical protein